MSSSISSWLYLGSNGSSKLRNFEGLPDCNGALFPKHVLGNRVRAPRLRDHNGKRTRDLKGGAPEFPGLHQAAAHAVEERHCAVLGRNPQLSCHQAEEARVLFEDWGVDDARVRQQGLNSAPPTP